MMTPDFLFSDLVFYKDAWRPCRYELKKKLITRPEDGSQAISKQAKLFMNERLPVEPGERIELFGEPRTVESVVRHTSPAGGYLEVLLS